MSRELFEAETKILFYVCFQVFDENIPLGKDHQKTLGGMMWRGHKKNYNKELIYVESFLFSVVGEFSGYRVSTTKWKAFRGWEG